MDASGSDPADDPVGPASSRRIGSYELLDEIARGGMGVVFRARELPLGRIVALKLLQAGEWASDELLQRFHTEARAASLLVHPNIVPVYAYGEDAGRWHIAMRLVEGGSLADRGRRAKGRPRSRVDLQNAAEIVRKLAEAVHYAHQRGVLHRDLKPGNVLVDAAGEPYLTDFGLARLQDTGSRVTFSYAALGTPAYVAPEVARGGAGECTVRSDIYGLGAILYELITGQPPFDGPTPLETLRQVSEAEVRRPSALFGRMDRDLETICLKALARDPASRYESGEALAQDLEHWKRGLPIRARAVSPLERSWKWVRRRPLTASLLALLVLAVLIITFGSWQVSRNLRAIGEQQRQSLVQLNVETANRLVAQNDHAASLRYQMDALRLDAADPARRHIHRVRLALTLDDIPELAQVWAHDGPATVAVFTTDERRVLSAGRDGTARLWDVGDGRPGPVFRHPAAVAHAFVSPDGKHVVTFAQDGLARCWDAVGGELRFPPWPVSLIDLRAPRGTTDLFDPRRSTVVTSHESRVEVRDLMSGGFYCPPLDVGEPVVHAAFNPEGDRIVVTCGSGRLMACRVQSSGLALISEVRLPGDANISGFCRDGVHVATVSVEPRAVVWNTQTGSLVGAPFHHDTHLRLPLATFGPVGDLLLTMSYDCTVRVWEGLTGKLLSREIRHQDTITVARWDAAGRRIVTGSKDGTAGVWDATLGRRTVPWLRHGAYVVDADIATAGNRVVTADQKGLIRLWNLRPRSDPGADIAVGVDPTVTTAFFDSAGTRLATAAADGVVSVREVGKTEAAAMLLRHPGPVTLGAFDRAGRRIVTFSESPRETVRLWDAGTGELLRESGRNPGKLRSLDFNPDGSRFVTTGEAPDSSTGQQIILWRTDDLEMQGIPSPDGEEIAQALFSPDGRSVVTSAPMGRTRFWDVDTGRETGPAIPGGHEFEIAEFSPDGRWLAIAEADRGFESQPATLWSVATHQRAAPPLTHQDGTVAVAFAPDSRMVATGGEDSRARVWEVPSGRPVTPPLVHENVVLYVAFDPTGRILFTSTRAGTVQFWDAHTGHALMAPRPLNRPILDRRFVRGSSEFLAVDDRGRLHRWNLSPTPESPEALANIEARLSGGVAR